MIIIIIILRACECTNVLIKDFWNERKKCTRRRYSFFIYYLIYIFFVESNNLKFTRTRFLCKWTKRTRKWFRSHVKTCLKKKEKEEKQQNKKTRLPVRWQTLECDHFHFMRNKRCVWRFKETNYWNRSGFWMRTRKWYIYLFEEKGSHACLDSFQPIHLHISEIMILLAIMHCINESQRLIWQTIGTNKISKWDPSSEWAAMTHNFF